ncbi:MAG: acylphosphatase [Gammaproteobacteria bacterium RIFOXYA12_FULL_61_12]|nr:MAG: acylphosphatase [Gammaproteobacteria bacterium RIFOXYA12_FULL_61_12]OGT89932.1 MAG: acylphosphatase [Gammaproteobacteria bacterium RIFOXYD12_FULL_61_37]
MPWVNSSWRSYVARICVRCLVSGRVQGVWFRDSTRRKAEELGITGSAANLRDGRVEVIACGEPVSVERLKDWLWQGPPAAEVTSVDCETIPEGPVAGFGIA